MVQYRPSGACAKVGSVAVLGTNTRPLTPALLTPYATGSMDKETRDYLDKRFAALATTKDLSGVRTDIANIEHKIDSLIETTNGLGDRMDRVEKKLDALLYQHRVVERLDRVEQVLRDKLHVEL